MGGGSDHTDGSGSAFQEGGKALALVGLRKMKEVGGRDTMSQGGGEIGEASRGHNPAGPGGWE